MIILEDRDLYKGIFWIKDLDDLYHNKLYFQIPVDSNGDLQNSSEILRLNSKNSDNYNHKNTWNELSKTDTDGHDYNYYPRGRVEINHGKAIIYANPNICTDDVKDWIIDKFNLTKSNGINKVVFKPDFSDHYKCYLDR